MFVLAIEARLQAFTTRILKHIWTCVHYVERLGHTHGFVLFRALLVVFPTPRCGASFFSVWYSLGETWYSYATETPELESHLSTR